jgi:cytochrome c
MLHRLAIAPLLCLAITPLLFAAAYAQLPLGGGTPMPATAPVPVATPDPATLVRGQCGTCHVTEANAPARQGPNLAGVYQRKAGTASGFKYSTALANAGFVWDAPRLDTWLTNPQAMLPGALMMYRQGNPAIRKTIIDWLKEQH